MTHEFLSVYTAKAMEYGLAIGYLLLFIPFWRFVQGGKPAAVPAHVRASAGTQPAARPAGATALRPAGWFHVPAGLHVHPGHTWARLEPDGLVTVGLDDFAHKLVGPATVELPGLGEKVAQGEPAVTLAEGGASVAMLSPVDGTVLAVNPALKGEADLADPNGAGWLFKVKPTRLAANLRQLQGPATARRMLEEAERALLGRMDPALGQVLQDGGAPVHGIARALAGDGWEELAREFFLT
jgi:glycine cleavage system H lipoate-binding protein